MGGRAAVAVVVAVWAGLACGAGAGVLTWIAGCGGVALALAALAARAPQRVGTVAVLLALFSAGLARGGGHHARLAQQRGALPADGDALVRVTARLVEPPLREAEAPSAVLAIERSDAGLPAGTRVRVRLPEGDTSEWGDRIEGLVRLDPPRPLDNPGGFDATGALDAAALAARGRVMTCARLPADAFADWPRATFARWRRALESAYARGLSPGAREFVTPLVLGDRSALGTELNAQLKVGGLIHLLALSGMHVVWLAAVARACCALLGGGPRARALAGALCALLYMGLAGPLPSLARAAATECAAALARGLQRALDPAQALAVSALALLLAAPGWATDLGFQLSCAATLGLVAVAPSIAAWRVRPDLLRRALAPTLAAQLVAFPLLLARFHMLAWGGLLSNLVAVPLSMLLLIAAWMGGVLQCLLPGAGRVFLDACEPLSAGMRGIAALAAAIPGAAPGTGHAAWPVAFAALGAALLVLVLPEPREVNALARRVSARRRHASRIGLTLVLLALAGAIAQRPLRPPPGRWWLVALDVGQGDALALGFRDGWWLVDSGPRTPHADAGEAVLLPFLRWAAVRRLELLVLTHGDGDHTGGAAALRRGVGVRRVVAPAPLPAVAGPSARLRATPIARGAVLHATAPEARVLWPPAASDTDASVPRTDNQAGLVLEVEGGRMLLMSDVDSTIEARLANARRPVVLKVGHHGSASSSGVAWLARTRPAIALISCGRRNAFGHPSPRVIERLANAGATVLRTDRSGALWLEFSRDSVRVLDWRRRAP